MASRKEMVRTLRELTRMGFTVETGRKHFKVRSPEGQLFTASITPSCPHAHKRLLNDIRRYRRGTP